jgi:hypothetical protein
MLPLEGEAMPKLVRLYIDTALIGLALGIVFVCALVALDVANLGSLVLSGGVHWPVVALMVVSFGTLFGGVQFAIAIMRLGADDE